jgi:hypothetical protein
MNHVLSLEAPETLNACTLRVVDMSVYADMPVICPVLAVTVPGFTSSVEISVTEGFSLNLTGCDLGIQTLNCGSSYVDLPDGIYILKYSVSPANIVFVEYNHLRMSKTLQKWLKLLCSIEVSGCEPSPEVKEKLKRARMIRDMLYAAKAQVEVCHHPKKGMEIFSYACRELEKMSCSLCV